MGKFDDVIERSKKPDSPSAEPRRPKIPKRKIPQEEPDSSLMDLFMDEGALSGFGDKINPEMKSQVIVPLANLLDKYGFSNSIVESETTNNAMNLVTLLTDVAPVIKGLADYVAGQRNALAEEDKMFLDEIMKASESGDFSDLFQEDGLIEESKPPEPVANIHPVLGDISANINQIDMVSGKIDWTKVVDPDGAIRKSNEDKANGITSDYKEIAEGMDFFGNVEDINQSMMAMPSLADLAAQAGLSMDVIEESDTTKRGTKEEGAFDTPLDEKIKEQYIDIVNNDIMDNIMDEIVYLDDDEVEKLMEDGYELEELEEEGDDDASIPDGDSNDEV